MALAHAAQAAYEILGPVCIGAMVPIIVFGIPLYLLDR